MSKEIRILGAGGHAKVVIEIAEALGFRIAGIFDRDDNVKKVLQYQVNHNLDHLTQKSVFLALGSNLTRKWNAEKMDVVDFNLIHPSAVISKNIKIGNGNVVMAGAIVNSSVIIGNNCIINTGACVDHDCEIDDYVHISPRVALAGNIKIGEGSQVGIGASVKQNVTIGKWSIVGAGAVVVSDVPDYSVVVGNPARFLRFNSI